MRRRLYRIFPLCAEPERELAWLGAGALVAFVFSFGYLFSYSAARNELYERVDGRLVLIPGALMPDFVALLGRSLWGFWLLAAAMVPLAFYHYQLHFMGSKSIYLMRRLGDPGQLWRRCLTVPVLGAVGALALGGLVLVLYYGWYQLMTPGECIQGDQWQILWNRWICG